VAETWRFNTEEIRTRLAELAGPAGNRAISRGLNKAATTERAAFARDVAKDMGIGVSGVKDALEIGKANQANLVARLKSQGFRIPLIDMKARGPEPSRGRGRGVSAIVRGTRTRFPRAFIATMRSGHRGVFERTGVGRLPILEKFGPSIAYVFSKAVPRRANETAATVLKNVQHEIEFEIQRLAQRAS